MASSSFSLEPRPPNSWWVVPAFSSAILWPDREWERGLPGHKVLVEIDLVVVPGGDVQLLEIHVKIT